MNEFLSEEIPFNDIPHNEFLAIKICKGLRLTISKDIPKLLADLIIKCWNAEIKNRPTTKELYQLLKKWDDEIKEIEYSEYSEDDEDCEYSEDDEDCEYSEDDEDGKYSEDDEDGEDGEDGGDGGDSKDVKDSDDKHINSSDLSSFQFSSDTNYTTQSTSANPISECLDVQLSELELNEICQDDEQ
ncbi:unnamed protein product [Rhizophagus irregularis]|nr:unnamed protein product [Rhizophagus irregularis]